MDTEPRSPLHQPRSIQRPVLPPEDGAAGASKPKEPKSDIPSISEKPEQAPQEAGRKKKHHKTVIKEADQQESLVK